MLVSTDAYTLLIIGRQPRMVRSVSVSAHPCLHAKLLSLAWWLQPPRRFSKNQESCTDELAAVLAIDGVLASPVVVSSYKVVSHYKLYQFVTSPPGIFYLFPDVNMMGALRQSQHWRHSTTLRTAVGYQTAQI